MSSFSPWGGLSEPGEACVKCGGNPTKLGAHAPTRGASPKKLVGSICASFRNRFSNRNAPTRAYNDEPRL
jgi:hypothetical protein